MPDQRTQGRNKKQKTARSKSAIIKKRTVPRKLNTQLNTFANISLLFKTTPTYTLDEKEFKFILATAIKTIHGDIANEPDILGFKPLSPQSYSSIIRFKTIHHDRVITSLLLFGEWKNLECKFEVHRAASTPCFLSI